MNQMLLLGMPGGWEWIVILVVIVESTDPLAVDTRPEPSIKSPSQTAVAVFSVAIV